MIVSELPSALREVVQLAQNFSRYRVTHDIWKSNQCRMFNKRPEQTNNNKKPRPKTEPIPKITLLSLDNSTTVTVLEVAQRLAKRRNLTLIKVSELEDKTQRPLYKLMNNANIFEEIKEDKDAQKLRKGTKLFYIAAKITEHDLWTKTKNMTKLLNVGHKVKVAITLDAADGVSSVILFSASWYTMMIKKSSRELSDKNVITKNFVILNTYKNQHQLFVCTIKSL